MMVTLPALLRYGFRMRIISFLYNQPKVFQADLPHNANSYVAEAALLHQKEQIDAVIPPRIQGQRKSRYRGFSLLPPSRCMAGSHVPEMFTSLVSNVQERLLGAWNTMLQAQDMNSAAAMNISRHEVHMPLLLLPCPGCLSLPDGKHDGQASGAGVMPLVRDQRMSSHKRHADSTMYAHYNTDAQCCVTALR